MLARSWLLHCPKLKIQELLSKCLQCPPSDVIMLQWKMGCQTKTRRVWFPHERTGNHSCEKLQIADAQKGMIRNQDMNSSNHLLVCSSFSRVHAYLSTPRDLKKTFAGKVKVVVRFFPGKKKIIKPSISLHPPLIRPSINRVRVKLGHPQQVGNHKTSPTSIKAQRSTRLEKLS